jgi:DNA-directed RNA polymerase specialized sigma24 family protein
VEKVVEQAGSFSRDELPPDDGFAERRATLARCYQSLPPLGSAAFWHQLENCQEAGQAVPLEVLVKVLRAMVARGEREAERRLFEIVLARVQVANEQWVSRVLAGTQFLAGERNAMAADLYADLCEILLHLLRDPEQQFWEEHFQHSLRFARKHAYERFMYHEGRWHDARSGPGKRVPSRLVSSLERAMTRDGSSELLEVRDERAEEALLDVEEGEIAQQLLLLPPRLRVVVWLIFWEDHTAKTAGELLAISERTVRNRLQAALAALRLALEAGQEVIDGRSA